MPLVDNIPADESPSQAQARASAISNHQGDTMFVGRETPNRFCNARALEILK